MKQEQERASRLLREASELAKDAHMSFLGWLLEQELEHLERPELRVLFSGPTAAGKTSTLAALLSQPELMLNEKDHVLPIGPGPTTNHIIDIYTGKPRFRWEARWRDGKTLQSADLESLGALLRTEDLGLGRVIIETPKSRYLTKNYIFMDSPGTGSFDGDWADGLFLDAAVMADLMLFHLRVNAPPARAKEHLKIVKEPYPHQEQLTKRLVVVLTDVRLPKKAEELLAMARDVLGFSPQVVRVTCQNDIDGLVAFLEKSFHDHEKRRDVLAHTVSILREVAFPLFQGNFQEPDTYAAEMLPYLYNRLEVTNLTIDKLNKLSEDYKRKTIQDLRAIASRQHKKAKHKSTENIDNISFVERLMVKEFAEQCHGVLDGILVCEFEDEVEKTFAESCECLMKECNDALEAFEQEIRATPTVLRSMESQLQEIAAKRGTSGIAKMFLGHLGRLGGRGGVKLGTYNFARKGVARAYRLFGKKAPAELIRKTIPRVLGRVSTVLKHLSKRFWLVELSIEIIGTSISAARAKSKLQKSVDKAISLWWNGRDAPKWTFWIDTEAIPSAYQLVETMVNQAWKTEDGIEQQISNVTTKLAQEVSELKDEIARFDRKEQERKALMLRLESLNASVNEHMEA